MRLSTDILCFIAFTVPNYVFSLSRRPIHECVYSV